MERTIRWWERLGVKLAAVITFVSVVTMGGFLALMLASERRHLVAQALGSAAFVSDTITRSIQHDMLRDQRSDAYQILDEIARQQHVQRLRIFDASGRIRYSIDAFEIGRRVSLPADGCASCHARAGAPPPKPVNPRTQLVETNGQRVLGAMTPIYNQESCAAAACHVHPASQRVLGEIELGLALEAVDGESASLRRRTIALSVLATLIMGTLTFAFAGHLVVTPVSRLLNDIHRVSEGHLDHEITKLRRDEFGALERSFNHMTRALSRTRAQRQQLLASLEQKVAERTAALDKAHDRLAQAEKLSSLGRLSASIAHEINNPLAGILTSSKLLIRTIEHDPTAPNRTTMLRLLGLVQREAERCSTIVRNLLGFARQRELTLTDADVNAAIDEALTVAAIDLTRQAVRIERRLGPVPRVRGDFGQLRQVFVNIVTNARDAMPAGGTLHVRTDRDAGSNEILVEFTDTGAGIEPERLAQVFDPFFTTKEKGTGLGLSVVYGIVQRHGGRVALQSDVGCGTTVTVWLPVADVHACDPPAATAVAQG